MGTTSAIINFVTTWSQKEIDSNRSDDIITDTGKLKYQIEHPSGTIASGIDLIFHESSTVPSGSSRTYDLTSLSGDILGNTFTKTFSRIKSITIHNTNTVSGEIGVDLTSSSGFGVPLGNPTGVISLTANSLLYFGNNQDTTQYQVNSTNKEIVLTDVNSKTPSYEIVILGNN